MKRKPYFSIAIPTYNRSSDLRFALFSIFRQTFDDYEVVVSDNCSTDNTKDVVSRFNHRSIQYFRNQVNIGMVANQKAAIGRANGKYIFFLGDDDFLLYDTSLDEIYQEIVKYKPGYARINYASLSFDRKHIFSYNVNKPFIKNYYLPPHRNSENVVSFIVDSDSYFFSGIIIKNEFPKNVRMVDADPSPWINILFHVTKNYGGYFIHKRHILALWSRRTKKNEDHGFYMPVDGKLKAENYFNAVKKKLPKISYDMFLQRELRTIYINLFPAIKVSVGNRNLLIIARRIGRLAPEIGSLPTYWVLFILSLLLPRSLLRVAKNLYLYVYMRKSYVVTNKDAIDQFRRLEKEYTLAS